MKILFIGGTGTISSACSELAVVRGHDLYLLNRGQSERRAPAEATILHGDIRDKQSVLDALGTHHFDVVVDWVAYTTAHIELDIELFQGRCQQFVFISSASAYQTPPRSLPVVESTPLHNPFWEYSRYKIACEERLTKAYRETGFPITIVRPSHTYDKTRLPFFGRWAIIDRMKRGLPVIVHGDGSSLWTLTHHQDFAKGFMGLLGNDQTIGEQIHITSDETLTWNQIFAINAQIVGATPNIVHVPSDLIAAYDKQWGDSLLGDKMHSMVFDNSKLKRFVPDFAATIPYSQGAREVIEWFEADPARQVIDPAENQPLDWSTK